MKLWRFPNPWDYHQTGGYLVPAASAQAAAKRLNGWLASPDAKDLSKHNYHPHAYEHNGPPPMWDADDAEEVTSAVYVEGGCDD